MNLYNSFVLLILLLIFVVIAFSFAKKIYDTIKACETKNLRIIPWLIWFIFFPVINTLIVPYIVIASILTIKEEFRSLNIDLTLKSLWVSGLLWSISFEIMFWSSLYINEYPELSFTALVTFVFMMYFGLSINKIKRKLLDFKYTAEDS